MEEQKIKIWLKSNLAMMFIAAIFIIALSYNVHVILISETIAQSYRRISGTLPTGFVESVLVMSVAGIAILILMAGNVLNLARMKKMADRACQQSQQQADAIEACGDGIAILTNDGIYTYMNEAHAQSYGYNSASQLIGKNWRDLYSNERVMWFEKEVFPAFFRHGEWRGRAMGQKKDGREFPQDLRLNKLRDGGIVCVVRDISEKVRHEALLKMIKVAVEAAGDGIAITDAQNKLLFMNRSFLKIHGYDPYERERYIGQDWRTLYNQKGQDQINGLVLPTTILKGAWTGTVPVMRKDGTLFYGDASLTKLPDGTVLGVMRDVSERRAAELEREELKDRLFQSQKVEAIGRLTQGMAHDFNNILAAIQGYAYIAWTEAPEGSGIRAHVSQISDACIQARDLVEQLLAFARKKEPRSVQVDLRQSLYEIQKSLGVMLKNNITPVVEIHANTAMISAQSAQIQRAILNLVQNAVEAMGREPGKLAISLRLADSSMVGLSRFIKTDSLPERSIASICRCMEMKGRSYAMAGYILNTQDYYQLTVSDTGCGIAKEVLPNIFDPFFSTKKTEKGAGLGLFAVLGTAINHGGAIIVETVLGEGTSIHLYLPKAENRELRAGMSESLSAA